MHDVFQSRETEPLKGIHKEFWHSTFKREGFSLLIQIIINLSLSVRPTTEFKSRYNAYAAAITEAEVDILTGQSQIRRVDILYDCGERSVLLLSLHPF